MKQHRIEILLTFVCAVLLVLFCHWQAPGKRMSQAEIDADLARFEQLAPLPAAEKAAMAARLRAWAEADDGEPVYMGNLMRYRPTPVQPHGRERISGTSREVNTRYESGATPLLFKLGAYPIVGGDVAGIDSDGHHSNLMGFGPALDDWGRILVVRYPSRRAFFELMTDPTFTKELLPLKMAALDVALTPVAAEALLPDLRLVLGALFAVFLLALGWWRAERRIAK